MALPNAPLLFGCHHLCGEATLHRMAQAIGQAVGIPVVHEVPDSRDTVLVLDVHSHFNFAQIPSSARGIHIVRDPRDMVLAGWLHHLHNDQAWLLAPRADLHGLGLKPYLQQHPISEGMRVEMQFLAQHDVRDMLSWNYHRTNMIELSWEQFHEDRVQLVCGIMNGLGFTGWHYEAAVGATLSMLSKDPDLEVSAGCRAAQIGMWKWGYGPEARAHYQALLGDAHERLGYEPWDITPLRPLAS